MAWSDEMKSKSKYFLYIHFNDPHKPYHRRSPWYEKKENPKDDLVSRYDSEINFVDKKIKRLYELFEWDMNTLLFITADHGEEFWEHDSQGHGGTLYSEVIHIPLIVQLPGKANVSKVIRENVSNMDVLPTIRSFLDIKSKETEEGVDLMPLIRGKRKYNRGRYIFSHLDRIRQQKGDLKCIASIFENWKLIFHMHGGRELFNLKEDPMEKLNVYEENMELAGSLLGEFMKFEEDCLKFSQKRAHVTLDEKELEELRALGYIK
jgi:arylsulfatase A-like enzyme